MHIYLLKNDDADMGEMYGIVVIAESELAARELAALNAGDEGEDLWMSGVPCDYLGAANALAEPGVVLADVNLAM